jgi:hypothetical protein
MILLDENLPRQFRQELLRHRIHALQVGYELSYRGVKDEQILPLLHRLHRATLFTRDLGLYRRELCHRSYCIVCLHVLEEHAPTYIRKALRHRLLNTRANRLGKIANVTTESMRFWSINDALEHRAAWT